MQQTINFFNAHGVDISKFFKNIMIASVLCILYAGGHYLKDMAAHSHFSKKMVKHRGR